MLPPKHTPYDRGAIPFSIGLKPLDLDNWLDVDQHLQRYLDEKERLETAYPDRVFAAETGTAAAQAEVLELIVEHLSRHHTGTHRRDGNTMRIRQRAVALSGDVPALQRAAHLVQEDLVLMRRNNDGSGWRIAAASLCFPSSWNLRDKFSKALADVHAPVPGFARGSRNATIIDRIFDGLQVAIPVYRFNWSIYGDDDLHHSARGSGQNDQLDALQRTLRVEVQTLRKLAVSGDILFTIRIHTDPVSALTAHPDKANVCAGFIKALDRLDDAQLRYKALDEQKRRAMVHALHQIASGEHAS
ncbi:MAG: DUF3445 domain-containing protein [Ahrensia sp.]